MHPGSGYNYTTNESRGAFLLNLLEELTFNAWPCRKTVYYDGWLLRFADGYTGRANSVNPLFDSTLDLAAKVDYCEALYMREGLDVTFKLTADTQPAALDDLLDARGYRVRGPNSVLSATLDGFAWPENSSVSFTSEPNERWLSALFSIKEMSLFHRAVMQDLLAQIVPEGCYALLESDGEIVALGRAVRERGHVGLFDIHTASHRRHQGFGTALVGALLQWGRSGVANRAYLQVEKSNTAALRLYAKFGFAESYAYWYRIKSLSK